MRAPRRIRAQTLTLPRYFLVATIRAADCVCIEGPDNSFASCCTTAVHGRLFDTNGQLSEIDHQNMTAFRSKLKALPGHATVKVFAEIKPAHSSIRFAQLVVRGRSSVDLSFRYELRLLKTSKDHREMMMTQGHGTVLGGSATSKLDEGALPIRFEEYSENSYRITPQQPLARGEYALQLRGVVTDLYCFGVDR